jgi:murein L,D-transpeptidase YcbB/YkuD
MPDVVAPWPLVGEGAREHPVRTLQCLLRAHGHVIEVDGVFGARTVAAVEAFQAAEGVVVDGIVGPSSWEALVVEVRKGSRGFAVRAVQEEFQFRNLSGDPDMGLRVDGLFGPETDRAVRMFQAALALDAPGVTVDGVVDVVTWRAMVSGMLSF